MQERILFEWIMNSRFSIESNSKYNLIRNLSDIFDLGRDSLVRLRGMTDNDRTISSVSFNGRICEAVDSEE